MKPLSEMGKYATVVVDPPWDIPMGPVLSESQFGHTKEALEYATLSLSEIAALPVSQVLADNATVFCWAVNRLLPYTFAIVEGWGLEYWLTMVWHKNNGPQWPNSPRYVGEYIIVGRKGKPKFTETKGLYTVNCWPVAGHSVKPEGFYDLLRRVTPGPRLDIFGRRRIAGFDSWGNEAPDGPALPDHYQQVLTLDTSALPLIR